MPIYEYECKECQYTFEEWQKISDKPIRTCPKCGKRKVRKLVSQSSFSLKGGGWYADGYSSAPANESSPAEDVKNDAKKTPNDESSTTRDGAKSETSPAEKNNAKAGDSSVAKKKASGAKSGTKTGASKANRTKPAST